jgi:hypothetical protein
MLDTTTVTDAFPLKNGVWGILLPEPQLVVKTKASATANTNNRLGTQEKDRFEGSDEVDFMNPPCHLNY